MDTQQGRRVLDLLSLGRYICVLMDGWLCTLISSKRVCLCTYMYVYTTTHVNYCHNNLHISLSSLQMFSRHRLQFTRPRPATVTVARLYWGHRHNTLCSIRNCFFVFHKCLFSKVLLERPEDHFCHFWPMARILGSEAAKYSRIWVLNLLFMCMSLCICEQLMSKRLLPEAIKSTWYPRDHKMARFIVAGNWKMNGSFESIDSILANLKQSSIPQGTGESITEDMVCMPLTETG